MPSHPVRGFAAAVGFVKYGNGTIVLHWHGGWPHGKASQVTVPPRAGQKTK